ncbi:MAG: RNB domain-containing ribonuclease [Peptococcaceae bacterium]|jgi:ribonuclease R|nr:RNB domain-containing ribonuclease [Peptococcaceae bacterium]
MKGGKRPEGKRPEERGDKKRPVVGQSPAAGAKKRPSAGQKPAASAGKPPAGPGEITGIFARKGAAGRVITDDRRVFRKIAIPKGGEGGAHSGDRVVVELTSPGGRQGARWTVDAEWVGKIVEVLGAGDDLAVGQEAVIRRLGLRRSFTDRQLAAAARLNRPVDEQDAAGRLDLRESLLVTIDGEDTRDIDDAVSLEPLPEGGWLLGVHIADVAHYVAPNTLLDKEAYARGTSVYFPDQVLPMLPPDLSNGICSLNQGEDRLAVSCVMTLDRLGKVLSYLIRPSVIRVREKLSYPQAQGYFNRLGWNTKDALVGFRAIKRAAGPGGGKSGDDSLGAADGAVDGAVDDTASEAAGRRFFRDGAIGPMLLNMARLCLILRQARLRRGALDFDLPECKIKPGEDGRPAEIKRKQRMLSEILIEEMMILANETVAGHYRGRGIPFPYRLHEQPNQDRLAELNQMLLPLGLAAGPAGSVGAAGATGMVGPARTAATAPGAGGGRREGERRESGPREGSLRPAVYQQLLREVKGSPKEAIVATLLLRSLNHAYYGPAEKGHFGLASDCYCHFTSPIRRYADLLAHRIIRQLGSTGVLGDDASRLLTAKLEQQCQSVSLCERTAEEAERKVEDLWKADYMSRLIGQEFDGAISGVTSYGLYVTLDNTATGMLHISRLPGFFVFDEKTLTLACQRTKTRYQLGERLRVRLESTDSGAGYIDFSLAEGSIT